MTSIHQQLEICPVVFYIPTEAGIDAEPAARLHTLQKCLNELQLSQRTGVLGKTIYVVDPLRMITAEVFATIGDTRGNGCSIKHVEHCGRVPGLYPGNGKKEVEEQSSPSSSSSSSFSSSHCYFMLLHATMRVYPKDVARMHALLLREHVQAKTGRHVRHNPAYGRWQFFPAHYFGMHSHNNQVVSESAQQAQTTLLWTFAPWAGVIRCFCGSAVAQNENGVLATTLRAIRVLYIRGFRGIEAPIPETIQLLAVPQQPHFYHDTYTVTTDSTTAHASTNPINHARSHKSEQVILSQSNQKPPTKPWCHCRCCSPSHKTSTSSDDILHHLEDHEQYPWAGGPWRPLPTAGHQRSPMVITIYLFLLLHHRHYTILIPIHWLFILYYSNYCFILYSPILFYPILSVLFPIYYTIVPDILD